MTIGTATGTLHRVRVRKPRSRHKNQDLNMNRAQLQSGPLSPASPTPPNHPHSHLHDKYTGSLLVLVLRRDSNKQKKVVEKIPQLRIPPVALLLSAPRGNEQLQVLGTFHNKIQP
jgi:hypothetical protein